MYLTMSQKRMTPHRSAVMRLIHITSLVVPSPPKSSTPVLEIVETNFDEGTDTKSEVQEPYTMVKSSGVKVETDSDVKVST